VIYLEFELLGIVLGFLQGLFEWLPVSSEGQLVIFLTILMGSNVQTATSLALFSHIGTAFVIIIYYRLEFKLIFISCYQLVKKKFITEKFSEEQKNGLILTKNLVITTIFTLPTALLTLFLFESIVEELSKLIGVSIQDIITLLVGLLLIVTGIILNKRKELSSSNSYNQTKSFESLTVRELIILGLLQGFAALPGLSRSGITITYLLLGTKSNQNESLRSSFLIAVPVSIGAGFLQVIRGKVIFVSGGLLSESNQFMINYMGALLMIFTAFIIGYLTLRAFIEMAKKIDFDKFVIIIGSIAIIAVLIGILI